MTAVDPPLITCSWPACDLWPVLTDQRGGSDRWEWLFDTNETAALIRWTSWGEKRKLFQCSIQKLNAQINTHMYCNGTHSGDSCMWAAHTCKRRGRGVTEKQRVDCVNKLCGSYRIPVILNAHAFPQCLTQHTVSMPEQRVCKMGNEWGRKPCWIQNIQPIQIHSKPLRTIASVNAPDWANVC